MTSSNSIQSTRPTGRAFWKNYSSFLDFTRNYERTSGISVPSMTIHVNCHALFYGFKECYKKICRLLHCGKSKCLGHTE